jgi:hypothetical protein
MAEIVKPEALRQTLDVIAGIPHGALNRPRTCGPPYLVRHDRLPVAHGKGC